MLQHRPHAPTLVLLPGLGHAQHRAGRRDDVIRVGRLPRTDTFRIGVEVLPRPRDDGSNGEPRPAA